MEGESDTFRTLAKPGYVEIEKIKGSRFIAHAFPFEIKSRLQSILADVRDTFPDASHHCWAYRMGSRGEETRYSDDGEPGGTAGIPILRQLEGRDLLQVMVVVTRYFGGTKLGKGGLVRAYGAAAAEVLNAAEIVERIFRIPVSLRFDYSDTSPVMQLLSRYDTVVGETSYGERTEMVIHVRRSQVDSFCIGFTDALSARGDVNVVEIDA